MKKNLLNRFSKYISYATTSDENSTSYPSTQALLDFADVMVEELKAIGMTEVAKDQYGYVSALLPANDGTTGPVIGFIAHLDTAPDMPGIAAPRIIENYDGKDIMLDAETNTALTLADFPELADYKGQTLLTTDGKTLLGADDKAGVAEIVCAMEYLIQHPEIKHGPIKVAFTPDEEIGQGVKYFDVPKFGCDFAYTMDGGAIGELEYENFNAASLKVIVHGINVHPGDAKNKMKNAIRIAEEFDGMLPASEKPELTEGYEGFYHLMHFSGDVEHAELDYIIRDHDRMLFEKKKAMAENVGKCLNLIYGEGTVETIIQDSYYNMKEKIDPENMFLVDNAKAKMEELGITPKVQPIRGGTDGARLSFMGLPCPNLCTGGHNYHGRFEYCVVESMEAVVRLLISLCEGNGEAYERK